MAWKRFASLAEAEAAYRAATWVYFEHGGQRLHTFEHPTGDAIYAFGPDSTRFEREPGKMYVEIPTAPRYGFFSSMAAALSLSMIARGVAPESLGCLGQIACVDTGVRDHEHQRLERRVGPQPGHDHVGGTRS